MKQVLIMQGVPGSGKSTRAKELAEKGGDSAIVSADNYFMSSGEYKFNLSEIGLAHQECLRQYISHLQKGEKETIIVDNTNTQAWECSPYVALAAAYGYDCKLIRVKCNPEIAAARNIHGVPPHAVMRMHKSLEEIQYPYGWRVE